MQSYQQSVHYAECKIGDVCSVWRMDRWNGGVCIEGRDDRDGDEWRRVYGGEQSRVMI